MPALARVLSPAFNAILSGNRDLIIPLVSTGTGAAVATLSLTVSANTTLSIDGNGKFYDDAAGTINEGTSRSIASGAIRTFYVKLVSGSCIITITKGQNLLTRFDEWTATSNAPSIYQFNLSNLPVSLTYFYCYGLNTVTGSIGSLPTSMTYFFCSSANTISGNLSGLPSGIRTFICGGQNSISGNLSSLPSSLTTFMCNGSNNTITGDLASIPASVSMFWVAGTNTIYGNLSSLPAGLSDIALYGLNTVSDYTPGKNWSDAMNSFCVWPTTGGGLSSTEIDNLIIDLNSSSPWSGSDRLLSVRGTNAPRTSASNAAVAALAAKGVTVSTS